MKDRDWFWIGWFFSAIAFMALFILMHFLLNKFEEKDCTKEEVLKLKTIK